MKRITTMMITLLLVGLFTTSCGNVSIYNSDSNQFCDAEHFVSIWNEHIDTENKIEGTDDSQVYTYDTCEIKIESEDNHVVACTLQYDEKGKIILDALCDAFWSDEDASSSDVIKDAPYISEKGGIQFQSRLNGCVVITPAFKDGEYCSDTVFSKDRLELHENPDIESRTKGSTAKGDVLSRWIEYDGYSYVCIDNLYGWVQTVDLEKMITPESLSMSVGENQRYYARGVIKKWSGPTANSLMIGKYANNAEVYITCTYGEYGYVDDTNGWVKLSDLSKKKGEGKEESITSSSSQSWSKPSGDNTCPSCHGAGIIEQYYTNNIFEESHIEECNMCHGTGKV